MTSDMFERVRAALGHRYTLERMLGRGAMGTVFLAEDQKHHRTVAIKVLNPELAEALGSQRFLREIEISARLHHPHILPLYDSGKADGFLFYVMPYVEGESLRDRLNREKQLPLDDALQIAREAADALSYAHSHNVVHRDIKPENILLESRHAFVADFGIARAIAAAGGETLTATGLAIGTPAYMSPEQAGGSNDLDGRTDLYSLGCVLFEMLAGRPPFTGPTVESIVRQHLASEPPNITTLRPAVPATVAAALQRALAKTPADRYNPVALFADALSGGPSVLPQARSGERSARVRTVGVGAAVVILAVAAGAFLVQTQREIPVPGRTTQVTFDPGLELDAAISPDGRFVAYAAGPLNDMRIHVRQIIGGRPLSPALAVGGHQRRPIWSGDGTKLLFTSGDRLYEVPALGGPARLLLRLIPGDGVARATWSPNGTELAYVRSDTLFVRGLTTGDERSLAVVRDAHSLAWSPDGAWIAYVSGNSVNTYTTTWFGNVASAAIWAVRASGGQPVSVAEDPHLNIAPAWLPDGRLLFVSNRGGTNDVYVVSLRRDGHRTGDPHRLTTGLNAFSISVSGDGRMVAYSTLTRRQNVWSLQIPERGSTLPSVARPVTTGNQVIEGVAISADGKWLGFDSNRSGNQDVYTRLLVGGELTQVTDHPADEFIHSWSPDGEWLAGHGFRRGNRDAFIARADRTDFQFLSSSTAHDFYPDWSPDGQRIAFLSERDGPSRNVYVIERVSSGQWSDAKRVTFHSGPDALGGPRWSRDGRLIAYLTPSSVRVVAREGGEPRVVAQAPDPVSPLGVAWSGDGRSIIYVGRDTASLLSFWRVPAVGGGPRLLVRFDNPNDRVRPEFVVRGDLLYFTKGEFDSDVSVMELETNGRAYGGLDVARRR